MKHLVGRKVSKEFAFVGDVVTIRKLSVAEVMKVQKLVAKKEAEEDPMSVVRGVIRIGVDGAEDMNDTEFNTFPIDELNALVTEILVFSGIQTAKEDETAKGN